MSSTGRSAARRVISFSALQGIAQVLVLVSSAALAVVFGPEIFGRYAVFLSTSTIIAAIIMMRADQVVASAETVAEAIFHVYRFLGLQLVVIPSAAVVAAVVARMDSEIGSAIALAMIGGSMSAATAVLAAYLLRDRRAGAASLPRLVFALGVFPAQVVFISAFGDSGVVYGHIVAMAISTGWSLMLVLRGAPKVKRASRAMGRYSVGKTRLFSLSGIVTTISNNLPVQVLSLAYGDAAAGVFSLVNRILGAPLLLLGNAISSALVPEIAQGSSAKLTGGSAFSLAGFAFVTITIAAGILLPRLPIPEVWVDVPIYLIILSPVYGVRIACIPAVANVNAARDGRFLIKWDSARLIGIVGLGFVASTIEVVAWVVAFAVIWFISYVVLLARGKRLAATVGAIHE